MTTVKEISLRVSEGLQEDVGKIRVRIDPKIMSELNINENSFVEIIGNKITGAIAFSAPESDHGEAIIRMDGLVRGNAGTSLGEIINCKSVSLMPAKKLSIAPTQKEYKINDQNFVEKTLKEYLIGKPVRSGDFIKVMSEETSSFTLAEVTFVIVNSLPSGIVAVDESTNVEVLKRIPDDISFKEVLVSYEDIGGLEDETLRVREMIELPLRHPELFMRLGIEPPKGVLLHGPPGCGKTLLAKAVANESEAFFNPINGPEIMSKFYGESEKKIREIFTIAEKNAPSIIFIDEIDSIAPKREHVTGEVERRVVAQLLALMDGLKTRGRVVVIAATNRVNAIDPALRRPGRFDREIEIKVPTREGRLEILQIHTRGMPLKDIELREYAIRTHGFVGADLAALCREAAMFALRRVLPQIDLETETIPPEVLFELKVIRDDFEEAMKLVEPSAMREVLLEIPNIKWDQVGGLVDVKRELKEAVELPLKRPDIFKKFKIRPLSGILLYGITGTGKTLLAKAIATESEANFIPVRGPEIFSKWVGESERAIRDIFRKARQAAPSIIFFDEIDAIASRRGEFAGSKVNETIVNQLLSEIDGLQDRSQVVLIAATNRPDILDTALLRPGRFDRLIYVPLPDYEARLEILKIYTQGMPVVNLNLQKLAERTEGYSGADLENLCREAVMLLIRADIDAEKLLMRNFEEALKIVQPSNPPEKIAEFQRLIASNLGRECNDLRAIPIPPRENLVASSEPQHPAYTLQSEKKTTAEWVFDHLKDILIMVLVGSLLVYLFLSLL
ncbi:MAG: AAA family ATPase [Promethearchaeota archaeon]|nr:MAG: AAA family ATPase [Candidatus Lokiarchaeota archaeon]